MQGTCASVTRRASLARCHALHGTKCVRSTSKIPPWQMTDLVVYDLVATGTVTGTGRYTPVNGYYKINKYGDGGFTKWPVNQ